MTDFDDDEKIEALTKNYGFSGQGRLLKIYRIIAKQMDESDRCKVSYSPGFWTRQLGFRSAIDCRSFLDRLAIDWRLISVQFGNEWQVECPNLLKIRARKNAIESRIRHLDIEVDVDKEYNTPKELFKLEEKPVDNYKEKNKAFEKFYELYPKKVARGDAEKAWKKIDPKLYDEILRAVETQKKTNQLGNPEKKFIPYPASWLNSQRWKDEVEKNALNGSTIKVDPSNEDWVKIMVGLRKNPENFNLGVLSGKGMTALLKIGGFEKLKTIHEDHMHFVKEDFKNAWLKS